MQQAPWRLLWRVAQDIPEQDTQRTKLTHCGCQGSGPATSATELCLSVDGAEGLVAERARGGRCEKEGDGGRGTGVGGRGTGIDGGWGLA